MHVTSEVDLSDVDMLGGLTSVKDDQVAVSAQNNGDDKILFLSVSSAGIISKTRHSIDVKFPFVYHIMHCNDRFYASEGLSNDIKVINTRGQSITTITNELFDTVAGISASNDHNTIYICSSGNDTVFSLHLNGKVKAAYRDKDLSADISVGHVIISDVYARSCAFNKIDNRLYLGQDREFIKVYEV